MRTARKQKKNVKQRGYTTHGFGSMKKNRGAGNRGGRGNAGSGKRGDAMKPFHRVKLKRELGKNGFTNSATVAISPVNLYYIENSFDTLKAKKYIKENKGIFILDISDLGFNKLLGTGKVTRKYEITTKYASAKAIEKIEAAGGKVEVLCPAEEEVFEEVTEEEADEE